MAISYPITLPSAPGYRRVSINPRSVVGVFASPFTYQQQVYAHPGQMWAGEFELPPMNRAEAAPWVAALVSLNGAEGTFYFGDPAWSTPRGVGTGTPLVKGASQVGYDLITDAWTAGTAGIVKAGDWLQIGTTTTSKLHMIMADANSAVTTGETTLTIWPKLRSSPADDSAVSVTAPKGIWRMSSPTDWTISVDQLIAGMTVQFVEAI